MKIEGIKVKPRIDDMWRYAAERQNVLQLRRYGAEPPWTLDPVIAGRKFTCVYRADDRVSQRSIRLINEGRGLPHVDRVFRTLLFKVFNRESTWDALEAALGEIDWHGYDFKRYAEALLSIDGPVYTSAYFMVVHPKGYGEASGPLNHLRMVADMVVQGLAQCVREGDSLEDTYAFLRRYESCGRFVAYQLALDLNYDPESPHDEDFVVCGPGADRGLARVFDRVPRGSGPDLCRSLAQVSRSEFDRLGLHFSPLGGSRELQPVDVEHLLCEFDKYCREAFQGDGGGRIKQKYDAGKARPLPAPVYPRKWGVK